MAPERPINGIQGNSARSETGETTSKSYSASIVTPERFMEEIGELLPQATRVDMLFMYAHAGMDQPLSKLKPQLVEAGRTADAGVHISVSENHLHNTTLNPKQFGRLIKDLLRNRQTKKLFKELDNSENVSVDFVKSRGAGKRVNLRGRAGNVHSKFVQIRMKDRVITYMPEFNLTQQHLQMENNALRFEESIHEASRDNSVSSRVANYLYKVRSGDKFVDYTAPIDNTLEFIVDAGERGKSLIQQKAFDMITDPSTRDIYYASQYPPFVGPTLEAIKQAAKKGVPSFIYLPYDCMDGRYKRLNDIFLRRIRGLENNIHIFYCQPTDHNPTGGVHSKALMVNGGLSLAEDKVSVVIKPYEEEVQGSALMTSHNQFVVGPLIGTGEAGFVVKERGLVDEIGKVALNNFSNAVKQAA